MKSDLPTPKPTFAGGIGSSIPELEDRAASLRNRMRSYPHEQAETPGETEERKLRRQVRVLLNRLIYITKDIRGLKPDWKPPWVCDEGDHSWNLETKACDKCALTLIEAAAFGRPGL